MSMHISKAQKQKGFTYVELIFAVALILIISTIVFMNFSAGEDTLALDRAAHKMGQDIRRSISLSLDARDKPAGCSGPSFGGYGMFFEVAEPNSYIIFADCNGSVEYEGSDVTVETIALDPVVEIYQIGWPMNYSPDISIVFEPPHPEVHIDPVYEFVIINLRLKADTTQTRTVEVNERGVIDIN